MSSTVWKYFDKHDKTVKCRLCAKQLLHNSGSTGTMINHLKHVHPMENLDKSDNKGQTKVSSFFIQPRACDKAKSDTISSLIADLLVTNVLPFNLVESETFRSLINFLEPKYTVPSRKTISALIERKYDERHQELTSSIANDAESVSLTTDCWSSMTAASYMTVTSHYIDNDWQLHNNVLSTRVLQDSHTAHNLRGVLEVVAAEFNIESKVLCCVSDNAANVVRALEDCEMVKERQGCAVHTLQLSVNGELDKIPLLRKTIAATSRLVGHVKRSSKATDGLRAKQRQFNLPEHKLIQSVITRWNSVFDMFERIVEQRWAVSALLSDRAFTKQSDARTLELLDSQWLIMEHMIVVLRPLKLATNALGADKTVTMSVIGPVINAIVHQHLAVEEGDSETVKNFKVFVAGDLKKRFVSFFGKGHGVAASHIASFLDPRHKHLAFLAIDEEKMRVREEVKAKVFFNEPTHTEPEPEKRSRLEEGGLGGTEDLDPMALLLGRTYSNPRTSDTVPSYCQELDRYANLPQQATNINPLEWWSNHKEDFPRLAKIARAYLAIPASSVSSERMFSAAGRLVSKNRSLIKPQNVNAILFLNKNK